MGTEDGGEKEDSQEHLLVTLVDSLGLSQQDLQEPGGTTGVISKTTDRSLEIILISTYIVY